MDVQLGVWKVVPRAEMFVHRRCCWLGFVAQKRFTCPRKKWGLNRAQTPFSADISRMQNNPPQTCPKSRSVASHVRPPSPPRSWLDRGSALSNENSGAGLSELLEEERVGGGDGQGAGRDRVIGIRTLKKKRYCVLYELGGGGFKR